MDNAQEEQEAPFHRANVKMEPADLPKTPAPTHKIRGITTHNT